MTTTSGPITPASESGITHAYILRRCLLRPPCIYREVRIHTPTFWRRGSDEKGTLTCLAQRGGRRRIYGHPSPLKRIGMHAPAPRPLRVTVPSARPRTETKDIRAIA